MTARWWVIHEDELRAALKQAHAGEDPGIVLTELAANSTSERVDKA